MAATITFETFRPRNFVQYFTKNLALACGLVAISTFNYGNNAFVKKRGGKVHG